MRQGWSIKKLESLFDVQSSKRVHKADWKLDGIPFYRAREVVKLAKQGYVENELYISVELFEEFTKDKGAPREGDLIISAVGTLGECYLVKKSDKFYIKDASVLWFSKKSDCSSRYIEYSFKSEVIKEQVMDKSMGATVGTLTISRAKNIKIPLPPLPEQQRIVSILDECFAAIDQAKANATQNLQNAKELFESYLQGVFENGDWEEKVLSEVCNEIFAGGDAPKNNYSLEPNDKHQIPIYANAVKDRGLYGYTDFARVSKPSITIAARGSGTGHTELRYGSYLPIVRLIVLIPDPNIVLLEFLKYKIDTLDILRSGSAIPQLTVPMIKDYKIPLISIDQQHTIVSQLDSLRAETQKLEAIYQQKLTDLEELKKSILQKAFSGDLPVRQAGLTGREVEG